MRVNKSNQLNIRVDPSLQQALDRKRIELNQKLGYIPSRAEVVRRAMEEYLGLPASTQVDDEDKPQ